MVLLVREFEIENHALQIVRKSKDFEKEKKTFEELERLIDTLGGVLVEED